VINLKLDQIGTFAAVADARSFRAAAERLHVAQSTVSARIRHLEESLGVRVLDRTTRSVSLTDEGNRLLAAARRAIGELEALAGQLKDEAALQRGRVCLAALPSLVATILLPAVREFSTLHPNVFVDVIDCVADRAINLVLAGDAELALTSRGPKRRELAFQPLLRDECLVIAPAGHPLARRATVLLEAVAEYPLLVPIRGAGFREVVDAAFHAAGLPMRVEREAINLSTLLAFAELGLGVTFLPSIYAARLDTSRCRVLRVRPRPIWRDIGCVTQAGKSLSPATRAFMQFLQARQPSSTGA
jgi:LysR family transcriptional regulator, carnitine catabolism transcriptional activator